MKPDRKIRRPAILLRGAAGDTSITFTLSDSIRSFSGIADSAQSSGKARISFTAELTVSEDGTVTLSDLQADQEIDADHIQLTVTDVPSEHYSASCLLSEGDAAVAGILPTDSGDYQLTISVTGDDTYTGSSQFLFTIP